MVATSRAPGPLFGARLDVSRLTERAVWAALPVAMVLAVAGAGGCAVVQQYRANQHIDRGEVLLAAQDLEGALAEFEAAAALAPQVAVAHSRMGLIFRRMGEYDQAIDCFIAAIRRDPFSFSDTLNLAELYHFLGRVQEAVQAYLHAVELRPRDFDAQLNLGVCYQQTGDFVQALDRFQRAIDIDPDRPHAYVNKGVALDAQAKYYEAVRAYKEALERDSRQPLVLVNLARTYMNQDRLKMAHHALEQAIRMDPQLAIAHESLGYCRFRLREYDAAEQSYKQALAYDWRLPRAHAGLGSINMLRFLEEGSRTDRRDRALEHWHRSLELDPDQSRIRDLIERYRPKRTDPESVLLQQPEPS
jgi:tetratricopeptide (TPR) repeat protein